METYNLAQDFEALLTLLQNLGIGQTFIAAIGSFAGAFFAFRFEKTLRDKDRVETEVASGNRALFTLFQIWNKQKQYQIDVVEKYRNKEDAWLNLAASPSIGDNSLIFDLKELSFLLQKKGSIFQFAILEADRFRNISQIIDQRNSLVLAEVFPRFSAAGLVIGQQIDAEIMKEILTVGIVRQLEILSAAIIRNTDENVASSREAFRKLRTALMKIHPEKKFIDFLEQ
jgi:hypothetical protein